MARKHIAKKPARGNSLLSRYHAALREQGCAPDAEFVRVKILPPAVRPTDVDPQSIRRAVRQAMREYVEKHVKPLEHT